MAASRHTLRFWEEGAVSFLCDITDQVPIVYGDGTHDELLQRSKLGRDEAQRMVADIVAALGIEWEDGIHHLAEAWRLRRDAKAARYGWFDDEGRPTVQPRRPKLAGRAARRICVSRWVQPALF